MIGIFRPRNDDVAALNMPAQNNLGVGFAVFFAELGKKRFFDKRLIAVTERIPRLNYYALLGKKAFQLFFLGLGMNLGLQNRGINLAYAKNLLNLLFIEV